MIVPKFDQPDAGVPPGDSAGRVVGRAVIHDKEFPVRELLTQHALDRSSDGISAVVDRKYDRTAGASFL